MKTLLQMSQLNQPSPTASCAPRMPGLILAAVFVASLWAAPVSVPAQDVVPASTLLDISGVDWIENDLFVAVHDGKNNAEERGRPRVSLLLLPADVAAPPELARSAAGGVYYRDLEVAWPTDTPNDLESIARIPGTRQMLLAESGDDNSPFQRIFLATLTPAYQLLINEVVPWPTPVFNVEATAVFDLGGQLFFAYAERAEGLSQTEIRWARMDLNPLRFGSFSSARYAPHVKGPGLRPVVALDVAATGEVYAATAYDSGEDNGPFRSFVSCIGRFRSARGGNAQFVPSGHFADVAQQDGFKIEGVALRPRGDGTMEVYAGTDDENYGAVLRQVAPIP